MPPHCPLAGLRRLPSPSLLILLLLLLVYHLPTRVAALTQPFNVTEIEPYAVGRMHSVSTTSPTTRALRANSTLAARLFPVYQLFDSLHDTIIKRRLRNDTIACNLHRIAWVRASLNQVQIRQIGQLVEDCHSRLDLNNAVVREEFPANFSASIKPTLVDARDALSEAISRSTAVPPNNPSRNWTRGPFPGRGWKLSRGSQVCDVDQIFAYRLNTIWYMHAYLTNSPVDAFMSDWQRQTVSEFVRKDLSHSLTLPTVRFGTTDVIENGTTFISRWAGSTSLSAVSKMSFDDNPALNEAYRLNVLAVDQAEDAITPSNIAILALPMLMSLIPVAILTDLNTCAMLWYIVFTDLFSALPFLIKGVELLNSATIKHGEVVAYQMGNETLSQMEVWAADCRGQDSFRVLGIVFISIAIASILLGVVLEVVGAILVQNQNREKGCKPRGPFGTALLETTAFSILGRAREDERDRRAIDELSHLDEVYKSHREERFEEEGFSAGTVDEEHHEQSCRSMEEANIDDITPAGRFSASNSVYDIACLWEGSSFHIQEASQNERANIVVAGTGPQV